MKRIKKLAESRKLTVVISQLFVVILNPPGYKTLSIQNQKALWSLIPEP